jgi:GTPase
MFCDEVNINVAAGRGGNGMNSFRRVLYNAKGGPDGGNGGLGGNIVLRGDANLNTLHNYRSSKFYKASDGVKGGTNHCAGATGEDCVLKVPLGTKVYNEKTGEQIVDIVNDQKDFIIARGGRGGYGNANFKTSVRQAPNFAELGEPGEELDLRLELQLVADVSIIGVPSAGKSTLISVISDAKPKIAEYHFTTIVPNLGVVATDRFGLSSEDSFVICDVPGLIKGASDGKGLGVQFLRHIKRSNVFVHLLDISRDNFIEDYEVILDELKMFDKNMLDRPMIVVFNKSDTLYPELVQEQVDKFLAKYPGVEYFVVSAVAQMGLKPLVSKLKQVISNLPQPEDKVEVTTEHVVYTPTHSDPRLITVDKVGTEIAIDRYTEQEYTANIFEVTGKRLQQIVVMTDFNNHEAVARVYDVLKKMDVFPVLRKNGIALGDIIRIGDNDLIYRGD